MNGGRVRDVHRPEPKCLSSTGELIDIERVTISLEGGRWKEGLCHVGGICPPNPLTRMPFLPTASSGASWHHFVKPPVERQQGASFDSHRDNLKWMRTRRGKR